MLKISNLQTTVQNFVSVQGKKSIVETVPNSFFGRSIALNTSFSGEKFVLPRFFTKEMREARAMNRLVLKDIKCPDKSNKFSQASQSDLKRLTDKSYEASLLRVRWVNPKDGKVYYLLHNGKTEDGLPIARILDANGAFVKEVPLKKKKIIVFEYPSDICLDNINNITHGGLVTLFVKRYNPFADVKLYYSKDHLGMSEELIQELDKDTAAISCAFTSDVDISPKSFFKRWFGIIFNRREKVSNPENLCKKLADSSKLSGEDLSCIPSHIRVFMSAGNAGKNSYNKWLCFNNVEGVGSLDEHGRIADFSSSRNSYFTQHYERGEFPAMQLPEGFMFTGSNEIDIPLKSDKFIDLGPLKGTSFSVSVRAAKVVLNQMMEGIL